MNNNLLLFLVIITLFVDLFVAGLELVVNINNNKVFAQNQNQNPNQNNTITTNTPCDFSFVAPNMTNGIKYAADNNNNNNTCSLQSYYQAGPLPDPYNDPTHIKAKQQFDNYNTFNNWTYTKDCDKGSGHPLCYNVGYYYGVIEANNDNSYYALHPSEKRYLYGCNWPFTANFCAGYAQAYSHTFAGHISNASEIWSEGYLTGDWSGQSFTPYFPINGSNPASCTEGPSLFCDGYKQGYPHGIEYASGNELGTKAADNDWNLKGANPNATEIITPPPCPPGHTTDWCNGFKTEYNEEWGRLTEPG